MSSEFETVYGQLKPALERLEQKRVELKKKGLRRGLWIAGVVAVAGFVFSAVNGLDLLVVSGILALLSLLIVWINMSGQSAEFSPLYKRDVIVPLIGAVHPGCTYTPGSGIAESLFSDCALFPVSPDRYHTEDLIEGKVGSTDFMFAEVHAEEKHVSTTKQGTHTYYSDIFRGFLFIADFHKDFSGRTVVRRNGLLKICSVGSRVKLEDPEFENKFDVFSNDQIEARYLLTPRMMELLLKLNAAFDDSVVAGFYNSKVLIAIPDRTDHFEAAVFSSNMDYRHIEKEYDTIRRLVGIVETLNLNTRIWMKE